MHRVVSVSHLPPHTYPQKEHTLVHLHIIRMYKARERQAAYCALLLQRRRPEGPELAIVKSAPTRGQHSRAREGESARPHCLSRAEPRFPSTEEDDGDAGGGGGKKKTRARAILPAGKSERERERYNFVLQCV